MVKLNLYKNNQIVLTKEGILNNDVFIFDNIIFNKNKNTLTREDDNFKYFLNFDEEIAEVTIKEQDYILDLSIKLIEKNINKKTIEIIYTIESEEVIENKLEIIFD